MINLSTKYWWPLAIIGKIWKAHIFPCITNSVTMSKNTNVKMFTLRNRRASLQLTAYKSHAMEAASVITYDLTDHS